MQTYIRKDFRKNWSAETEIMLEPKLMLSIDTSKRHTGEIATVASVHIIEGRMKTHRVFEDYNKCLAFSRVRCTSKAVENQHMKVMSQIETIKADVARFYSQQPALLA